MKQSNETKKFIKIKINKWKYNKKYLNKFKRKNYNKIKYIEKVYYFLNVNQFLELKKFI